MPTVTARLWSVLSALFCPVKVISSHYHSQGARTSATVQELDIMWRGGRERKGGGGGVLIPN